MRRRRPPPAIGRVIAEVTATNQLRAELEHRFAADQELERQVRRESHGLRSRSPIAGTIYTAPAKPSERPITARPVGDAYTVRTRGRVPVDERGRKLERESIDTIATGEGCYRRAPTCRD